MSKKSRTPNEEIHIQNRKQKKRSFSERYRKKISEPKRGPIHGNWKGGRFVNGQGYVMLYMPNHSSANHLGYVLRSHLVWHKHTGELVDTPRFCIHHKNKIRNDDRFENLQKMTKSAHSKFHASRRNDITLEQLYSLRQEGLTTIEAAKILKCCRDTISNRLQEFGLSWTQIPIYYDNKSQRYKNKRYKARAYSKARKKIERKERNEPREGCPSCKEERKKASTR